MRVHCIYSPGGDLGPCHRLGLGFRRHPRLRRRLTPRRRPRRPACFCGSLGLRVRHHRRRRRRPGCCAFREHGRRLGARARRLRRGRGALLRLKGFRRLGLGLASKSRRILRRARPDLTAAPQPPGAWPLPQSAESEPTASSRPVPQACPGVLGRWGTEASTGTVTTSSVQGWRGLDSEHGLLDGLLDVRARLGLGSRPRLLLELARSHGHQHGLAQLSLGPHAWHGLFCPILPLPLAAVAVIAATGTAAGTAAALLPSTFAVLPLVSAAASAAVPELAIFAVFAILATFAAASMARALAFDCAWSPSSRTITSRGAAHSCRRHHGARLRGGDGGWNTCRHPGNTPGAPHTRNAAAE